MKVLVFGASGRVGQALVQQLVAAGHEVVAAARHPEVFADQAGVTPLVLDLHEPIEQLSVPAVDAAYFVAGSRGKELLQIDAYGAVKAMALTEKVGAKRFIMLSSLFATVPEKWSAGLTNYNIAKFFADHWLMEHTQLDYTILQPGALTEAPATGQIQFNVTAGGANPIPDVAATLAALLAAPNTSGKVLTMLSGTTPIADAVAAI